MAGAPESVVIGVNISSNATLSSLHWDVTWINKRPTRLPESIFVSFNPAVPAKGWKLQVAQPLFTSYRRSLGQLAAPAEEAAAAAVFAVFPPLQLHGNWSPP